ncbi:MAG: hypothetical protein V2A73_12905, partial [Pseudomonadota bacterium]
MLEVTGNVNGLRPAQVRMLERIYRRRLAPNEVVGPELATFLCECSDEIGRQVGILIDRLGRIEHVVVGDAHRLVLPDVGRLRGSKGRFRGLRLVHTHLRGEPLSKDDLTDLVLLRLDLVAALGVERGGRAGRVHAAHLLPPGPDGGLWRLLPPEPAHHLPWDFAALIRSLEAEYARRVDALVPIQTGRTKALIVQISTRASRAGGVSQASRTSPASLSTASTALAGPRGHDGPRPSGVSSAFHSDDNAEWR